MTAMRHNGSSLMMYIVQAVLL